MAFAGDERGYAFLCDWFGQSIANDKKVYLDLLRGSEECRDVGSVRETYVFEEVSISTIASRRLVPGFHTVTVYNRQLNITDYATQYTRQVLGNKSKERTIGIICSNAVNEAKDGFRHR